MSTSLVEVINAERTHFAAVCADPGIEFEREASFAIQMLQGNEFLAKTAISNQKSLKAAVSNVAAIGISLNPAKKLAYLVPRDGKVCLDVSYMGLMHIAQVSGAIKWGQAVVVRQNDTFELQGIDQPPLHRYNPFAKDRGEPIGVYVVVKTSDGDYLTHSMSIDKINDIRDRSSAWKAWMKNKKSCPWVTDYEEMAKKTVIKQAAKMWPRRDRLDSAIHNLNTELGEGLAHEHTGNEKDITELSEHQEKVLNDLRAAALEGTQSLLAKHKEMKEDASIKADFTFIWKSYGEGLKKAAAQVDETNDTH